MKSLSKNKAAYGLTLDDTEKRGRVPSKIKATDMTGFSVVFDSMQAAATALGRSASYLYNAMWRGKTVRGVKLEKVAE